MKWPGIIALTVLIIGILYSSFLNGFDVWVLIVFIPISIIIFIAMGCVWECIRRPKTVVIAESGVIMKMRYGQGTEMVKWNEIEYLSFNQSYDITTYYGRDGYLEYGKKSRTIYRPIVLAIRERYKEITGKYPPIKEGFH
jgi:presenilin-like A22 family membrane protease